MNFNLQKALLLIACLNLVLFVGGVRVVEDSAIDSFIDVDSYKENSTLSVDEQFKNSVPQNFEKTGESSTLNFIDTLQASSSFLIFVVNIIFTPIGLFATLPSSVALIVGLPILIASVISLLYFIRSGR